MSPQTHSDFIEYTTVEIDGRSVRVRTTPPPMRRRDPEIAGTLAPAGPRRALPPSYTLTPAEPRAARPAPRPSAMDRFIEQIPGFAAVIAAAVLMAGFVGILVAG